MSGHKREQVKGGQRKGGNAKIYNVKFEVLTTVTMKITAFQVVTPFSLVGVCLCSREINCFLLQE